VTAQTPVVRSKWWYLLPIFLGIIGGVIAWVALKSNDRHLAKNCLILGITLIVAEVILFASLLISSDSLNLITQFGSLSDNGDFGIRFKIDTP
jgi:uncharacterized Tic20 family protein